MACNKCKKQQQKEYVEKQLRSIDKWVLIFLFSVGLLSIYGVYSLIKVFL